MEVLRKFETPGSFVAVELDKVGRKSVVCLTIIMAMISGARDLVDRQKTIIVRREIAVTPSVRIDRQMSHYMEVARYSERITGRTRIYDYDSKWNLLIEPDGGSHRRH